MRAKGFAGKHVRQMDLDDRYGKGPDRIMHGYGRVRVGGRIDDKSVRGSAGLLNPVHKNALVIALPEIHRKAEVLRRLAGQLFDVRERRAAVLIGFPGAEQVQIGTV